jgi:hypothetical protein
MAPGVGWSCSRREGSRGTPRRPRRSGWPSWPVGPNTSSFSLVPRPLRRPRSGAQELAASGGVALGSLGARQRAGQARPGPYRCPHSPQGPSRPEVGDQCPGSSPPSADSLRLAHRPGDPELPLRADLGRRHRDPGPHAARGSEPPGGGLSRRPYPCLRCDAARQRCRRLPGATRSLRRVDSPPGERGHDSAAVVRRRGAPQPSGRVPPRSSRGTGQPVRDHGVARSVGPAGIERTSGTCPSTRRRTPPPAPPGRNRSGRRGRVTTRSDRR